MKLRYVTLNSSSVQFTKRYRRIHHLPDFSASVKAGIAALRQTLLEEYETFAREYNGSPRMQSEAELWLEHTLPRDG